MRKNVRRSLGRRYARRLPVLRKKILLKKTRLEKYRASLGSRSELLKTPLRKSLFALLPLQSRKLATKLFRFGCSDFRVSTSALRILYPVPRLASAKKNRWVRLRFFFKEGILAKRAFRQYFDGGFSRHHLSFKLSTDQPRVHAGLLIHPEYRLDILLWRSRFFFSLYDAENHIKGQNIFVNGFAAKLKYFAKEGDIVSASQTCYRFKQINTRYILPSLLAPFVEADYYSRTLCVVLALPGIVPTEYAKMLHFKPSAFLTQTAFKKG